MDNTQEINNTVNDYLSLLNDFEIELSEEEQQDLDELNNLLKNHKQQNDLTTDIWNTIKQATIDSVEQIVGLSDRGDWRPEQGAVITTPLNFREGVVASEADKKRYEMWQDRVNGKDVSASEFRNDCTRFKASFENAKKAFKDIKRSSDGSYNNDYNDTVVYDWCDPRTYNEADSSGDMVRDTKKTVNVDHINSVKSAYEDAIVALYGGHTKEGFDKTMRDVENAPENFAISDEHANKSMKDQDTLEVAQNNPELGMDPEKVKHMQARAEKSKNKRLLKSAIGEKSKEFALGVGKSTLAATSKMLVGLSMKIAIRETVAEFQQTSEESLLNRVKRVIHNIIERAKSELKHIWSKIAEFAANNAISEIVNLILNYFVSTVKNIFKLIRCLFGSIIQAFKIIFDESRPWEERLFEALKIISAGIAMATGTILNELIAKAIATYIPFMAGFAGDISAVISGLISSILSALVLMSFDRYKASLQVTDENYRIQLLNMQLSGINNSCVMISSVQARVAVSQTADWVRQELISIVEHDREVEEYIRKTHRLLSTQKNIHREVAVIQHNIDAAIESLRKNRDNSNKRINDKLNSLPEYE